MATLDPRRWHAVSRILDRLGRVPPSEREARRVELCDGDPLLQAEVKRLHGHYDYALSFDPQPEGFRGLEIIGQGGMGVVFRAVDEHTGETVALKFLDPERIGTAEEQRFRKEHGFLLRLRSPAIPRVFGLRTTDRGEPFLVMELIDGKPVHEHCDWQGLDLRGRVDLFADVCTAVGSLHSRNVIHRDLSPRNILIDAEGRARIIDFGTARVMNPGDPHATHTMCVPRTPRYSSPEQIRDEPPSFATDVYSLGLILFELLSEGGSPYGLTGGEPYTEVERAILNRPPSPVSTAGLNRLAAVDPKLQDQVDVIVLRCMAKDPKERYRDANALHLQLSRAAAGEELAKNPRLFFMTANSLVGRGLRQLAGLLASPRFVVGFMASAAVGAATLALITTLAQPVFGPILDAKAEGNSVRLFTEDGREKIVPFPSKIDWPFLLDLDGDGRNECFISPQRVGNDRGKLFLLDDSGNIVKSGWPFFLDLPNPYLGRERTDRYGVLDVAVLNWNGEPHVAAAFSEDYYWRSVLVLLNARGEIKGHLWHPGHMQHIEVLDGLLVISGFNNRLRADHKAYVLFAIDPSALGGESPPYCGTAQPNRRFSWYYGLEPTTVDTGLIAPFVLPDGNYVDSKCGRRFFFDNTGVIQALDADYSKCPEGIALNLVNLETIECPSEHRNP